MFCNDTSVAVEQSCHCFLRSPDVLVLVEHLYTLFLVFCMENQELRRTVSYLVFLCHWVYQLLQIMIAESSCHFRNGATILETIPILFNNSACSDLSILSSSSFKLLR